MTRTAWIRTGRGNYVLDNEEGEVFVSYQPNNGPRLSFLDASLDSVNPETAVVLVGDKELSSGKNVNRYLIFRGDHREQLENLYPDVEKMKEYWKEHGGHFWSDSLKERKDS